MTELDRMDDSNPNSQIRRVVKEAEDAQAKLAAQVKRLKGKAERIIRQKRN